MPIVYVLIWAVYIPFALVRVVVVSTREFIKRNEAVRVRAVLCCVVLAALGAVALYVGVKAPVDPIETQIARGVEATGDTSTLEKSTEGASHITATGVQDGVQLAAALKNPSWNVNVAIGSTLGLLRDETSLEQAEQLRDWAVIGTVTRLALSDEGVSTALRRAPPARLPYLEETQPFEYGRGRHTNVGAYGLIFFEVNDPHATSVIGAQADALRTELGVAPEETYLFSLRPLVAEAKIEVRLVKKVARTALFGADYGYHEGTIKDVDSLREFVSRIDDLSYSRKTKDGLVLGGRARSPRRQNLTIEDIAALASATKDLAEKSVEFEAQKKAVYDRINDEFAAAQRGARFATPRLSNPYGGLGANSLGSLGSLQDPPTASSFQKKYDDAIAAIDGSPDAPGFSLDPSWRTPDLKKDLETLSRDICALAAEARAASKRKLADSRPDFLVASAKSYVELAKVTLACRVATYKYGSRLSALAAALGNSPETLTSRQLERKMGDFFDLTFELRTEVERKLEAGDGKGHAYQFIAMVAANALEFFRARNQVQCARYDGTLRGTAVGMTLFYTDLMAKLWQAVDFDKTAPTSDVPGFLSSPRVELEPYWAEELARKPATRIWFGPLVDRFAKQGDEVYFAPIATRVFAKGSSGNSSKEESEPSESSRRTIGWWDRHYTDVADYEEQYHVLNEIQKWTLLLAWTKADELGFMRRVPYKSDWRYDEWSSQSANRLRFKQEIALRSAADSPTGTECIDILQSYPFSSAGSSYTVSGGVSLGSEKTLELSRGIFRGVRESASELAPSVPSKLAANEVGSALGRLRAGAVEIPTKSSEKTLSVVASQLETGASLTLRSGEQVFGRLRANLDRQGVALEWREAAHARAPRLIKEFADATPVERLQLEAGEQVASIPDGRILVRAGQAPAMLVGPVEPGPAVLAKSIRKGTLVGVEQTDSAATVVDQYKWQRFTIRSGGESLDVPDAVVAAFESNAPVGGPSTTIRGISSGELNARIAGDEVWIARPDAGWGELASRPTFDPVTIRQIREAASAGREVVEFAPRAEHNRLANLLLSDDATGLGKFVADATPETLQASVKEASARIVAYGDAALLRGQDKTAVEMYGLAATRLGASGRSLTVRKALAELGLGDARAAKQLSKDGLLDVPDSIRNSRAGSVASLLRGTPTAERGGLLVLVDGRYGAEPALRLPRELKGHFLDSSGRASVLRSGETNSSQLRVYVDDGFNLARRDLEAQGEGLLVDFDHRPNVTWQEVELAGLGDVRTYALTSPDGRTFHELPRHSAESFNTTRAILVRNCSAKRPANDNAETELDPCG